ncbi:hypothetical protein [Catenuloplanes atrovinosus]|uniref:Uncharacterized protein n=1 Tax=Catenuloplanes atrovinosus TaxID=137266 RepID=A0AAE3YPP2_9ACTN|nr:hypothetical protein [Catenuloplanes atrovinosus]MDR7276286.1 hypothetical protein [Catenuloplanes atrovinosus]
MTIAAHAPSRTADRIGRTLLALCAAATMVAFANGITRVASAPDDYLLTEFWRTVAYLVFTGLWVLLAWAPRAQRGVWELILLHKGVVTVQALLFLHLPGAVLTAWIDGTVTAVTVAALILCRGWQSWRRVPDGTATAAVR